MKTFNEWRGLSEAETPVEDGSVNIQDIANPEVLNRVNAFVGSIADREYLNPNHAIAELRQKLGRIGITFGDVNLYENEDEAMLEPVSVPLMQWGGRTGKDDMGEKIDDDGISHRVPGGLDIYFEYMKMENGSCKVFAKIA